MGEAKDQTTAPQPALADRLYLLEGYRLVLVLAAMKQLGHVTHAFGPAHWWGESMFGIDNALVGDWPVVTLKNSKAKIAAFGSIPRWLERHGDLLKREMSDLGQLWEQRLRMGNEAALQARTPQSIIQEE